MGREFSEQTEGLVLARSRSVASSGTLPQWNGERPCRRHRHTAALTLAVSKPSKQSPARNKRIELATRANPSCASGILFESILRSNDSQNGFHTAKTLSRPLAQGAMNDSSAPGAVIRALANTVIGGRGVTAKKIV